MTLTPKQKRSTLIQLHAPWTSRVNRCRKRRTLLSCTYILAKIAIGLQSQRNPHPKPNFSDNNETIVKKLEIQVYYVILYLDTRFPIEGCTAHHRQSILTKCRLSVENGVNGRTTTCSLNCRHQNDEPDRNYHCHLSSTNSSTISSQHVPKLAPKLTALCSYTNSLTTRRTAVGDVEHVQFINDKYLSRTSQHL